ACARRTARRQTPRDWQASPRGLHSLPARARPRRSWSLSRGRWWLACSFFLSRRFDPNYRESGTRPKSKFDAGGAPPVAVLTVRLMRMRVNYAILAGVGLHRAGSGIAVACAREFEGKTRESGSADEEWRLREAKFGVGRGCSARNAEPRRYCRHRSERPYRD